MIDLVSELYLLNPRDYDSIKNHIFKKALNDESHIVQDHARYIISDVLFEEGKFPGVDFSLESGTENKLYFEKITREISSIIKSYENGSPFVDDINCGHIHMECE